MDFACVRRGQRTVLRTIAVSSLVTSTWTIDLPASAQTTHASNGSATEALKPLCVQPDKNSEGKINWDVWGARLTVTGAVIGLAISEKERVPVGIIRDIILSAGAAASLVGPELANADKASAEPPRESLCDANAASKVLPQYRSSARDSSSPGWYSNLTAMLSREPGPSTRTITVDHDLAEALKRSSHPPSLTPAMQRALKRLDEQPPKPTSSILETTQLQPGLKLPPEPTTRDPAATQPGTGSWKLSPEEEKSLDERYQKRTLPASDVSQTLSFELQMQYLKNRPEAQQGKSTPPAPNAHPASQAVPP